MGNSKLKNLLKIASIIVSILVVSNYLYLRLTLPNYFEMEGNEIIHIDRADRKSLGGLGTSNTSSDGDFRKSIYRLSGLSKISIEVKRQGDMLKISKKNGDLRLLIVNNGKILHDNTIASEETEYNMGKGVFDLYVVGKSFSGEFSLMESNFDN